MISIDYPKYPFKVRQKEHSQLEYAISNKTKDEIFDPLRKKWVSLTPEEWVRQNMVQYMVQVCNYPNTLIAIEKSMLLGELVKRFDILLYKNESPWMIIECKAANVQIDHKTIEQLYQYQQVLNATYLIASNGHQTIGAAIKSGKQQPLLNFPEYL